jgi:hypothetical protein
MTGITNINIQPSVVVNIHKYNSRTPHTILHNSRMRGDIFKFETAFVQVEFIITHIRGEKNIRQSVIIYIARSHAASIIKIPEKKTILDLAVDSQRRIHMVTATQSNLSDPHTYQVKKRGRSSKLSGGHGVDVSLAAIAEDLRDSASRVRMLQPRLLQEFRAVVGRPIVATRIRCPGDCHLHQVLFTGNEKEPAGLASCRVGKKRSDSARDSAESQTRICTRQCQSAFAREINRQTEAGP